MRYKELWDRLKSYHNIMIKEAKKELKRLKQNKEGYNSNSVKTFIEQAEGRIKDANYYLDYMKELEKEERKRGQ